MGIEGRRKVAKRAIDPVNRTAHPAGRFSAVTFVMAGALGIFAVGVAVAIVVDAVAINL